MMMAGTVSVLLFASCAILDDKKETGILSVVISDADGVVTRASEVKELSYEKAVNTLQIFIFEGETLFRREKVDSGIGSLPWSKSYGSLKTGSYKVYVVANAPDLDQIDTERGLNEQLIRLSDCSLDGSRGFVMAGRATAVIGGGAMVTASVPLTRFAARVRLASVENQVPATYAQGGAVTVKSVFLINALGTWNLAGSGSPVGWVNLGGRAAGRSASSYRGDYIASQEQVHPAAFLQQVFRMDGSIVANGGTKKYADCCLYSFPNLVQTDHTGSTATEAEGAMTRLVVLATVNGADWWYPVTLFKDGSGIERNTSYDVRLTIRATGSTDPNEPVGKGSLSASVSVSPWIPGAEYAETI